MKEINKKTLIIIAIAFLAGGILSASFFVYSAAVDLRSIPASDVGFWGDLYQKYLKPLLPNIGGQDNASSSPLKNLIPPQAQAPSIEYSPPVDYEQAVIKAVENASPVVVSIIISKDVPVIEQCPYNPFGDLPPDVQQFFGQQFEFSKPCQKGTRHQDVGGGSGFIISSDGLIATNKHVVLDESADYTVFTNDGKKYGAKVVSRDPISDLAIIKVSVANLSTVKLGDSSNLKLGQTAIAIGNALGEFRNTVSVGVISGLSRKITASGLGISETIGGLIQTDAAINPGNSGGPLLNLRGEVIGINTAVASGAENIGFAIPINQVKRAILSVKQTGQISTPYLGARYLIITPDLAKKEKLSVDSGALVRGNADGPGVIQDSPADKAGLKAEDIILEVNGEKISIDNPLSAIIQKYSVGDAITLKILRAGKEMNLSAVLEQRPKGL